MVNIGRRETLRFSHADQGEWVAIYLSGNLAGTFESYDDAIAWIERSYGQTGWIIE
jgi:hypothetical protein